MSEPIDVKQVRAELEHLRHHANAGNDAWRTMPGMNVLFGLADAFVTEGLKVCEEAEAHATRGITKFGCLNLIAVILKSAGVMR